MASSKEEWWNDSDDEAIAAIDVDVVKEIKHPMLPEKYSLECDRILQNEGTPLERYRPKYLIVSDLASQKWCEQKLLYDFSVEVYLTRVPAGVEVKVEEDVEAKAIKGKGSDIHLARELEIQVPVEVPVETAEDKWAVKFLNLCTAVCSFHHHCLVAREVPVFGCPFDSDVFIYGIVDELQYDPTEHSLKISELKTRRSCYPPRKSHQEKDIYQVGLYRQLFDELVMNKVTKAMIRDHLGLDLSKPLSDGVVAHIVTVDIGGLSSQHHHHHAGEAEKSGIVMDLDRLLDHVFDKVQSLTRIQSGQVEYVNQDTKLPIAVIELDKDEDEIRFMFEESARWWKGERGTKGVDVEDCWKCHFCTFSPWCEWREVMAEKTAKRQIKGKSLKYSNGTSVQCASDTATSDLLRS